MDLFTILCKNDIFNTKVEDTLVSLKVRSGPSINSTHITTLASGKDVVAGSDSSSQKWVSEGGVNRLWRSYAYPLLSNGKYTNSTSLK